MNRAAGIDYFQSLYATHGAAAQRRYPNEELLRFFGRELFSIPKEDRHKLKILEVGCGSGANLWMVATEGYDAYGIDYSSAGLALCADMLKSKGCTANLKACDMRASGFPDAHFHAVLDVFSSYCLNEREFEKYLDEVSRILEPGGLFFCYTPSKLSDAFINHAPASKIDDSTISGIYRKTSPFAGNHYPFRFTTNDELGAELTKRGFSITGNETVGRTYNCGTEYFAFTVVSAEKFYMLSSQPTQKK